MKRALIVVGLILVLAAGGVLAYARFKSPPAPARGDPAIAAAVASLQQQRTLATVGDGGFWHNAFLSGVTTAVKNGTDAVLLIFKNGYTSATGTQDIVSTPRAAHRGDAGGHVGPERVLR